MHDPDRNADGGTPVQSGGPSGKDGIPEAGLRGDWTPDQFRAAGHAAVEWAARYFERMEEFPVLAQVTPGEIAGALPAEPPEEGEPFEELLADLDSKILPGITHWNHPGFFAYFGITGSGPGILGEMIAAAFNTNGMLWRTSPSTTELELTVMGWLRRMMGLPDGLFGFLTDTASISSLLGLAAAREAVAGVPVREEGLSAPGTPRLRLYTSTQAHSSIDKAAITLGLGLAGVRRIDVDEEYRMRPEALEAALREDREAGWHPFAVSATVGTTSTTSVDPIPRIAEICRREGLWLHVDAAYAGSAAVLPECRWALDGCEEADSFVVNPHKWLFVPIDCSAFYTRHPDTLKRAFQLVPEYLRTSEGEEAVNLMDYGVQLGRRFRAVKLWWVLRTFGAAGIRERLAEHIRLARLFAGWVDEAHGFERAAPVPFSVVCFRAVREGLSGGGQDSLNERLLDKVNRGGEIFLSHTKLGDRFTLRLAVGNLRTQERHVRRAWEIIREVSASL